MVQAAGISPRFGHEPQLLGVEWRRPARRVPSSPGAVDPGLARARSREARVEATCRRMSRLLREVAYRLARRLPAHVEVEELIGAGAVGLVTAVRQHLEKPPMELERLAARRIRGAIMDHLRATDHLTRRQRAAVSAMQRARAALERDGTRADIESVASRLGLSTRRATQIHDRLLAVQIGSLDNFEPASPADPVDDLLAREDRERVAAAVAALPKRLRILVSLCYFEELSYRDVSLTLGISRSRVCQLHAQALRALRQSLGC